MGAPIPLPKITNMPLMRCTANFVVQLAMGVAARTRQPEIIITELETAVAGAGAPVWAVVAAILQAIIMSVDGL